MDYIELLTEPVLSTRCLNGVPVRHIRLSAVHVVLPRPLSWNALACTVELHACKAEDPFVAWIPMGHVRGVSRGVFSSPRNLEAIANNQMLRINEAHGVEDQRILHTVTPLERITSKLHLSQRRMAR
jgi:hypothetical protein